MEKPFAPSAEKNKQAILETLRAAFADVHRVLEIGSGTGQHAVHIAAALPHLLWQTSEMQAAQDGVRAWVEEAGLANLPPPIVLDVSVRPWNVTLVDGVFSANTVHYMPLAAVESLFAGVDDLLDEHGVFVLYGPFNYDGRFISEGNRRLDAWLKEINPEFGIRDIEAVLELASSHRFALHKDVAMPANNRLLWWRRATGE